MQIKKHLIIVIFSLLGIFNTKALCQSTEIGIRCNASLQISPRWKGIANIKGAQTFSNANYLWWQGGIGISFLAYDNINIISNASITYARYNNLHNKDLIYSLSECAQIKTDKNYIHKIIFEQRKLIFKPSSNDISCSRFTYSISKEIEIKKLSKTAIVTELQTSLNIKSDINDSPFIQRVRAKIGIMKEISKYTKIGLYYKYCIGSKNQKYVDDAHKYNSISMTFDF